MSEYLNFDADGYPSFIIPTGGGQRLEGNPANSTVYLHDFQHKGLDHIFVETGENEQGECTGSFVWRIISRKFSDEGMFDDFARELIDNGFDVIEREEPHPGDVAVWEDYISHIVQKVTNKGIKKWLQTTD